MKYFIILCMMFLGVAFSKAQQKIIFVGASITEGARTSNPQKMSYPAQLQDMLGSNYQIENYGASSRTMLRKGDYPYWETEQYVKALQSTPNIVFIDLGGNDAKNINRKYIVEMQQDCEDMIRAFRNLESKPRVVVLLPTISFETDTLQIWDKVIVEEIVPQLENAAYVLGAEVLSMRPLLVDRAYLLPDKIHPEDEGSAILAQRLYEFLNQTCDVEFDIFNTLNVDYVINNFKGYQCANFTLKGKECKIVKPKKAATNKPWIWRARFWAHEPQVDIALLERGYHLVYCDVSEMMGNFEALSIWNDFYNLLVDNGLSTKSAMEGMSRGAMYVLSWAATYPERVESVYIDNPLLDCRYLAERDGELNEMVQNLMSAYKLKTKEDLKNFKQSPIDKIPDLVKGRFPILILSADQDEAVPPLQAVKFTDRLKEEGGKATLIIKEGFKHHPHSLPNPETIVRFIIDGE